MRNLLQRVTCGFRAGSEHHFDLAAWRAATGLRYFGIELALRQGSAEVRLRHIGADGGELPDAAHLVRTIPGSAYSPPLALAEMGARLMPEVVAASDDAEYDLNVFTDDLPVQAAPRVAYVVTAPTLDALQPTLMAFAAVPDAGRLLVILDSDETLPPPGPSVTILRRAPAGAWGQALHALAYGEALSWHASHVALVEPGVQIPAETFARLRDMLRFAQPGHHIGAVLHGANGEELARGRTVDLTALSTAVTAGPAALAASLIVFPRRAIYRLGLPWPGTPALGALDYPLRLRRAMGEPVIPAGLHVVAPALPPTVLDGPDLRAGLLLALREGAVDSASLSDRAAGAMAELLHTGVHAALTDEAPPQPQGRGLLGRRPLRPAPNSPDQVAAKAATLDDDYAGVSSWNRLLAGTPGLPGAEIRALDRQMAALHTQLCDQDDALQAAIQTQTRQLQARLDAAGIGDPARTRADLDRANILAVASLRGRHTGRRAVIVGNGPSLRISDLDRLKSDITFASNKIFLAYDQTGWRPTYYSVEDHLVLENSREQIERLGGSTKIFPSNMRDFRYHASDTIFVPLLPPKSFSDPLSDPAFPAFGQELTQGIGWGSTVVYSQIQLALYMGCSDIVLIGLDHSYDLPDTKVGNAYVAAGERNHFHPDYRRPGEVWHQPNIEVLEVSFARARAVCEARNVPIINASRESRLDVFERADFETLFPHQESPA
ncbi:MAG: DUF115 domain-containing protein [Rhodobacter sp.]|nr:DUF115 domain-containing protein [Paracoccaceae bacterium]MCC0077389.1 DUF115 domain-containing protein [Rhodobacter sp.]